MQDFSQFEEIKNFTTLGCNPDQIIRHLVHNGEQIPLEKVTIAANMKCPRCGGNEGMYTPHLDSWFCSKSECLKADCEAYKRKEKGIKDEMTHVKKPSLDDCHQPQEVLSFLKSYSKEPKGFVVLAGKNGTGKTFAAQAVYQDFNVIEGDKKFITQVDLNLLWHDHITAYSSTTGLLRQFCEYKLLILDDIGTTAPRDAFMDFLYALADKRYRDKDKIGTVITTNLTSDSMRKMLGDAFTSRVVSGHAFKFDGKDRRRLPF